MLDDIPALVQLGKEFHEENPIICGFDADSLEASLRVWIATAILLTDGKDAMICGFVNPVYFNHSVLTAHELFWFVRKGKRNGAGKALLEAFRQEARARGATVHIQTASETGRIAAVDRLYRRQGFEPLERGYIKEL